MFYQFLKGMQLLQNFSFMQQKYRRQNLEIRGFKLKFKTGIDKGGSN